MSSNTSTAYLVDFATGRVLREATASEHADSQAQIEVDGVGIIQVDGLDCYTETDTTF